MNLVLTVIFIICTLIVSVVPFRFMYGFSAFIAYMLSTVVQYRKAVVIQNLKSCFPDYDDVRINEIARRFYLSLSDIFLEWIKVFSMSRRQIIKRHYVLNPELLNNYLYQGRSVIIMAAHYNNWEWGSVSSSLQIDGNVVGFYKPLNNKWMDRLILKSRSRTGTTLVSIFKTAYIFEHLANVPSVYLVAADQSPSNSRKAYWINFFGMETAFLRGAEHYAKQYNHAVVYVDFQRIKRGHYTAEISVLADNPSELKDGEITQRFASKLESVITAKPENWLWSHRRWKLSKNLLPKL